MDWIVEGCGGGGCGRGDLKKLRAGASVPSVMLLVKIAKGQTQILRLTTPKLKNVWGPFRSG